MNSQELRDVYVCGLHSSSAHNHFSSCDYCDCARIALSLSLSLLSFFIIILHQNRSKFPLSLSSGFVIRRCDSPRTSRQDRTLTSHQTTDSEQFCPSSPGRPPHLAQLNDAFFSASEHHCYYFPFSAKVDSNTKTVIILILNMKIGKLSRRCDINSGIV